MRHSEPRKHELGSLVVRGVGWVMASQAAVQISALLTSVVVARFMLPREVGLATEAIVFGQFALVVVDFGFAAALVQRAQLTDEDLSTAFWASMALGIGLTVLGIGLSWPIASLYGEPRVQSLFAVLSLIFVFAAPGIVQGAVLTRALNFRSLEVRTITATIVSCSTAMALSVLGFGAWAIIAQSLTMSGVSTLLLWRSSPWRPRALFSFASLRDMSAFTGHVFGARSLGWANQNLDNFLVGRFVGAAALGAYSLAYAIALTPVTRIATPITQVFFPAFSRIREPGQIAEVWLRAVRMLAFVVVPAMLGLIVVAPELVDVVFGAKWHAAGPVMQILAPIGLLQSLTYLNNGILQSLARTRLLFRSWFVITVVSVAAFAAGLPWGIKGVATAYLLASVVLQPAFLWLTTRAVGISVLSWMRSVSGVFQAGVGMMLVVLLADRTLSSAIGPTPRLLGLIALGAIVYGALILWRAPQVKTEVRGALRRRRLSGATPATESDDWARDGAPVEQASTGA